MTQTYQAGEDISPEICTHRRVFDETDLLSILDTIDVPVVVVGRDLSLSHCNRAAAAVLDIPTWESGLSCLQIPLLNYVKDLEMLCGKVMVSEAPIRREIRDGDRWFALRIAPYSRRDRQIDGVVLTFTNLTAFRASLDQAIYEREYTKAILNTVNEPLVVLDAELRVQTANGAFYELFQTTREQTQNAPLPSLCESEWKAACIWDPLKAILSEDHQFQTTEIQCEFPHIGKRTLLANAARLAQVDQNLILLVLHDITERKAAEEAVRRAEQDFRDFVDTASIGMHWVGPDGIIMWANKTELCMLGYEREEYIGHHIREFHVDEQVAGDILARLTRDETLEGYSARLRCRGGSIRDVLINSNVLWDGNKFIHTRCFTRDVTDEKLLEDALRRSLDALQDTDRRKNEFLATLAHELRNPLAPIQNVVQFLHSGMPDQPGFIWARDVIDRQVRHLGRLVDDLMDLSRITEGKIELQRERLPISAVVASAIETSKPLIESCGHQLSVALPTQTIFVSGDAVRLSQVLSNLLNNAAKYTPQGGQITLAVETKSGDVSVRIRDSGIGIEKEMLSQIFEMFTQVGHSFSRAHGGLGIGLTLARRLANMHGGRIEVNSDGPGKGSEFIFSMPIEVEMDSSSGPHSLERTKMGVVQSPKKILVADDNCDAADSLAMLLRLAGHDVTIANDGIAAVEKATEIRPDLILLDIGMPKLNGYDAAKRIRGEEWADRVVLVALTGWGQEEDKQRAIEAGFRHHLVKPIEHGALDKLLEM